MARVYRDPVSGQMMVDTSVGPSVGGAGHVQYPTAPGDPGMGNGPNDPSGTSVPPQPGPGGNTTDQGQPPPTTTTTPPPTDTTGTGGGGGSKAFTETFNQPFPQIGDVPLPNLPTLRQAPAFALPSAAEAMNDPGYQFRVQQGLAGLQASAAARGSLNDSGTLKALSDYNQNAASQEYANVVDRDLNTYNTNYKTQYTDPYNFGFQNAIALWQPQFSQWQAQNQQANTNYGYAYQKFLDDYARWRDQQGVDFGTAGGA